MIACDIRFHGLRNSFHNQNQRTSCAFFFAGLSVTLGRKKVVMPAEVEVVITYIPSGNGDQPFLVAYITTHCVYVISPT